MKFVYAVWIWICLSGFGHSAADEIHIEGNEVTITCSHEWASDNKKYFCRDPCNDKDNYIVSSDQTSNGRFRLKDSGNGTFTVTIIDLKESDSGIYWCGVDRSVKDTYHEVNLRVSKADKNTNTSQKTPTPETKSDSQTSTSRSFTPAPDDITISSKGHDKTLHSADQTFFDQAGPLVGTAVGLTVMLIIFLGIFCMYKRKKRKSHSSRGSTPSDVKRGTTEVRETAGEDITYVDITETQQQTDTHPVMYSTVNHNSAANQIQDSSIYSNLSIQPYNCSNQTANPIIDTVTYAAIYKHKVSAPKTFRSEDSVTYASVCS
ncbi:trem-like transcript 4 protein [Misgurnus anguillicaudatus]|uniref:trem-like transcript 4 protein n=1 Tax=Misgurnus anguillicaudatus TaxID=75329 RepID=UPI003CCFA6E1